MNEYQRHAPLPVAGACGDRAIFGSPKKPEIRAHVRIGRVKATGPYCRTNPKIILTMKKTKDISRSNPPAPASQIPTHDRISAKAEEIWINRGRPEGRDQEIWF